MIKKYTLITLGSFLLAVGVEVFLVPNRLAIGGVSGTSTIIHHLTGWHMGALVFIINIPIFIIGFISEGKNFLYKSLYGTIMLSVFLELLTFAPSMQIDNFISSVFGGVLSGLGIGLALLGGGTTGGTDILAKVLNKKLPHLSIGFWVLFIDAIVIGGAILIFRDLDVGLYSTVGLIISSIVVDYCTEGVNFTKTVYIITNKADEISGQIHSELKHGVTAINAKGTYTNKDKTILLCTIHKIDLAKIITIAKKADPNAFLITADTREIYGEGFKENTP